ncbi:MAG: HEAT repeat domain-containing protein [Acidobacteriota bacterium]
MIRVLCLSFVLVSSLALGFVAVSSDGFEVAYEFQGTQAVHEIELPTGDLHSITWSLPSLSTLEKQDRVKLRARDGEGKLFEKRLVSGDADFYSSFKVRSGILHLEISSDKDVLPPYTVRIVRWRLPSNAEALVESEPNDSWQQANPIELGKTVWAGGDDQPYFPLPGQSSKELMEAGADWYRFDYQDSRSQLVYFWLDLLDRDNIPVDLSVFQESGGELVSYEEGTDPVTPPHEVQAMHGNKFTTRVLRRPGRYYLRVLSHHPSYQLKTAQYALPPYTDPRQAVVTAVDYVISAGDSWHANTPRKGGVFDRISNYHHETSLCVACHPTHFSLRAQLHAARNGYRVRQRPQVLFLTERFYNNPTPFYGHSSPDGPAASWTRVISAPANVLSRMGALITIYEQELSRENRNRFLQGIGEYLKLYYKDRDELPPDETNGNQPLVSTFEVAWYSWEVLNELHRRLGEHEYAACRDRIRRLVEKVEPKNMIDLCYQTLGLISMDREAYSDRIRRNSERIIGYQRSSGQWAATFEPDDPEAEFQTGHCLWTLAVAGYSPEHPAVAKGVDYLLKRQQEFGGWFDPLQSYENFSTPFRESQMAVLALSELYPSQEDELQVPGSKFNLDFSRPDLLLSQLDDVWQPVEDALLADILKALVHPEPQVRAAAATSLGRVSKEAGVPELAGALGDSSKSVQRAAAWALRQIYNRTGQGGAEIARALESSNERVRWSASRIFAQHFSEVAKNTEISKGLLALASDPVAAIRIQALKGMWQLWHWTADQDLKSRIEDLYLARLAAEEDQRVLTNLRQGLYILADQNIRYLYNNWIPSLAAESDRDQAVLGRLALESRLAGKLARALQSDNSRLRQNVLLALSDFHLRAPDAYELEREPEPRQAALYTRIGNDIETVKFFGTSADLMTEALLPLLRSDDLETRRLAARVAFTVREDQVKPDYGANRKYGLGDVIRLAGPYEARVKMADVMLGLLNSEDPALRAITGRVRKSFTPLLDDDNKGRFAATVGELLQSPYKEARAAAWDLIGRTGSELAAGGLEEKVHRAFIVPQEEEPASFLALPVFPSLLDQRDVQMKIYRSLASENIEIFRAALQLCLDAPQLEKVPFISRRLMGAFVTSDIEKEKAILSLASSEPKYLEDLRVISLVSNSLDDEDVSLSGSALGLVRKHEALQEIPAVAEALARRNEGAAGVRVKLPDFELFQRTVQPILETVGSDGKACVNCHRSHAILSLTPPSAQGTTTEEQVREHYRAALRVIDLLEPEKSLILRKPTSSSEAEGVLSTTPNSHGGGVRWEKDSPAYRTILEWIQSAFR